MIVAFDLAILFVFCIAIVRLRYYESLFERDQQMKYPTIQDFSVFLQKIPIKPEDYYNDKDLL